ncbi:MAG: serine protease, partial [Candidatus Solibacter sp.]|nr:serine protease [Candidatus Solibacter sp.]
LRVDPFNDLALLSVDAELSSSHLRLAEKAPQPGDSVFAISNPKGLERTISTGVVSGLRKVEGRDLIQISSPLSAGSSGGPILNSQGEVIGVAVGINQR